MDSAFLLVRDLLIRLKGRVYLLLRRFVFARWSRTKTSAKPEWLVTKGRGTTGRRKKRSVSPFRLPLGANLHRERERGWARGRDRVMLEGNGPGICCFLPGMIAMKMKAWFGKHSIPKIETVSFLTGGSPEWLFTRYREQLRLRHSCPIKNSESGRGLKCT